jgi:hypothetical protein
MKSTERWKGAFQLRTRPIREVVVAKRKLFSLLPSVAIIVVLGGCGGNNNTTLQNPPAPATTSVAIAFSPAPAKSITLAATEKLTAVVSNDPSDMGVDWALLCQNSSNCGTLLPLHTPSGTPATYKPPSSISGNSQSVTIEAFATANHNSNVLASLTVTAFASILKGNYVFATQGQDVNGEFQLAGVVVLDGNGNVTSGEQTHSDPLESYADAITGGSYYVGPDGRGTLTLNTADQNIGQLGIENLSVAVLSSSKALISTFDNPNLQPSTEISSGTLELQTSKATPTGGYAFAVNGVDINSEPMAMGGVLNIDSPNAISGTGSVTDQDDAINGVNEQLIPSGSLTAPDSFGSLKFNLALNSTPTTVFAPSLTFTGYIVDTMHIKLVESDINGTGAGYGSTAGVGVGQGAAQGTFTSNTAFAGNYVFDIAGQDYNGTPDGLASYGVFTADASGNLNNGYDDEALSSVPLFISDSFTGTYTIDPSGTGRVDSFVTFTNNGPGPELILYLTGNGNPPLILDADDNGSSLGFGSIASGVAHPQAPPPFSFSGDYGVKFIQSNGSFDAASMATGQATAKGTAGTFAGVIDTNVGFSPNPDTALTGTFGAIADTGRFSGTLENTYFSTTGNMISVDFYAVNPDLILFIETDLSVTGLSTFGYFPARTPVCNGCP